MHQPSLPSPGTLRAAGRRCAWLALVLLLAGPVAAQELGSGAGSALGEAPILTAGPVEYRPGRGLRLGSTGFTVGGFTNVKGEDAQQSGGEFSLDLLNFFIIFDKIPRFRAVAELQMKDIFVANDDHAGGQDFAFEVRRLFGDYTIADELHVRAGTFLTPVGYWNLILAPPLTWTTEEPVIVEKTFFQETTTGVMLHGTTGLDFGQLGYAAFSQFLDPISSDIDVQPPNLTAGGRVTLETSSGLTGGITYQAAQRSGWTHLGALHFLWEAPRGEVLSELYVQGGDPLQAVQWGTYLQGVLEVYEPFYLVARYEHYAPPSADAINLFTIGSVVKPLPFMALKVEYRFADERLDGESLQGFFASFTTFF